MHRRALATGSTTSYLLTTHSPSTVHHVRLPRRAVRLRALHTSPSLWSPPHSAEHRASSSTSPSPSPPTTPATRKPKPSSVPLPPQLAIKNVLRDSASVLRRLAPVSVEDGGGAESVGSAEGAGAGGSGSGSGMAGAWAAWAERAAADLGTRRRARVAIVGDRLAGTRELVTALLEDPLGSSGRRKAVWARWDGVGQGEEVVRIRHGDVVQEERGSLTVPSTWLQKADCELYEVVSSDLTKHLPLLISMDSLLLITDQTRLLAPLAPLLPHLPVSPLAPTSLQLIINRTANHTFTFTPAEEDARIQAALEAFYRGAPHPPVVAVSSTLAREALEAYQGSGSAAPSTDAVRTFQEKYLASRITVLAASLSRPLPGDFQLHTAAGVASAAMGAASFAVVEAEREVEDARRKAMWLGAEAERELARWAGKAGDGVREASGSAAENVRAALGRFAFWKLPWRVDDLGSEVRETVERTYGRELERKLCYDAGRLTEIQAQYSSTTTQTLASFASPPEPGPAPFHSPILQNKLAQLTSLTTLTPSALLHPVARRRRQLTQPGGPVDHLHLRAQKLVLAAWGAVLGSPVAGVAGWMAWDVPASTALAGVGFVWVATAWWCQGAWGRAGRRFWQDWERVGTGLEVDLKRELQDVVQGKVLAKPLAAAEGIRELVSRRETVLAPIKGDLQSAQKRLDEVISR